jgi:hypothetical protein
MQQKKEEYRAETKSSTGIITRLLYFVISRLLLLATLGRPTPLLLRHWTVHLSFERRGSARQQYFSLSGACVDTARRVQAVLSLLLHQVCAVDTHITHE